MKQILLSIVLVMAVFCPIESQAEESSPLDYNRFDDRYSLKHTQDVFQSDGIMRNLPDELKKQYEEALVKYKREAMQHRLVTLWTQYLSSIVILVIVMGIVIFGIMMSYKQFKKDLGASERTTTIKFGQYGVEVSTSVIGVVILLISLVFFYLYIVAVFPITEIGAS